MVLFLVGVTMLTVDGGGGNSGDVISDSSDELLYCIGKGVGGVGNGGDSVATGVGGGGNAASVGEGSAKSAKNRVDSALFFPFITDRGGGGVGSNSSSSMMPSSSFSK